MGCLLEFRVLFLSVQLTNFSIWLHWSGNIPSKTRNIFHEYSFNTTKKLGRDFLPFRDKIAQTTLVYALTASVWSIFSVILKHIGDSPSVSRTCDSVLLWYHEHCMSFLRHAMMQLQSNYNQKEKEKKFQTMTRMCQEQLSLAYELQCLCA